MWMGTYPSVPSRIRSTGKLLSEHLKDNPGLVGPSICDRYGPDIPFLPKVKGKRTHYQDDSNSNYDQVLSFAKALPL
jgi:hypothetical protein